MIARYFDWIWQVRGSLPLAPGQTQADALGRLDPLFHEPGTRYVRGGDVLTFHKKDQPAQDKMAVFDAGVLQVDREPAGTVLRYHLKSRALLFCFLAPLLFLAFGQLTVVAQKLTKPTAEELARHKKKDEEREKTMAALPQNPLDKWLGAPAPEMPKKDKEKDKKKGDGKDEEPSFPIAAYVFAGLFAALYVVGRVLEDRLVKSLFRRKLLAA